MRKLTIFLAVAPIFAAGAAIPFHGAGVNTHATLLPVGALRAIGLRWVRADLPASDLSAGRVQEVIRHYSPMPVLWILPQGASDPAQIAREMVDWGVRDLECGNEPDIAKFNPGGEYLQGADYGRWFAGIRRAVGHRARLYGPVTGKWFPAYIQHAIRAGMHPDAIAFHGYGSSNLASDYNQAVARWHLPVVVSEVGPEDQGTDPAVWFLSTKRQMGNRPWCYYDGPATDWRGLFAGSGMTFTQPTDVYRRILQGG